MSVYIHKSILALEDLNLTEKLVLAYLLVDKNNLKDNNAVIANRLNLTKTTARHTICNLKAKKIIDVVGAYNCREITILKNIEMKFEKSTFNGFFVDDDILKLDLNMTKKFILAEIKSLLNSKDKKCTASNLHIANLLNLTERAIRIAISQLEEIGILKRNLKNINGKTERTIILNLNNVNNANATDEATTKPAPTEEEAKKVKVEAPAPIEKEVKEEATTKPAPVKEVEEKAKEKIEALIKSVINKEETIKPAPPAPMKDDEVLNIFESFPKRPLMSILKIEEQKKLCLPILKSKTKEELDFIKFVINYNKQNNESWKAGFMPYMYKFLEIDKEKYFNEDMKIKFEKTKNKPKVIINPNLQLLQTSLSTDIYDFFAEMSKEVWELSDEEILEEFKMRYAKFYTKFNKDDFNKMAMKEIKEYRPSNLFSSK